MGVEPALGLSISVHNMLRSRSMPMATLLSPEQVLAELNRLFGMDVHDDQLYHHVHAHQASSPTAASAAAAGHRPPWR